MSKKREIKGMYFQMIDQLLSEYNPEIAEEAAKELSFDIKSIKPGDWLPREEVYNYVNKTSAQARAAVSKQIYPTIKANTPLLNDAKSPIDIIHKMNEITPLTARGIYPEYNIVESKDGYLKLQVLNDFTDFPEIDEGMFIGIFEMFKILRVHINTEKVADNELMIEIKWEA